MLETLVGLVGLLAGLVISEYFRRRSRIEGYAQEIFIKRLNVYEELFKRIHATRKIEAEIEREHELTAEEKVDIWSTAIISMANFLDENELYIEEEITAQTMLALIGLHSIFETNDSDEQEKIKRKYSQDISETISMIKSETGLSKIERHYKRLTNAKHNSDYLHMIRKLRKKAVPLKKATTFYKAKR